MIVIGIAVGIVGLGLIGFAGMGIWCLTEVIRELIITLNDENRILLSEIVRREGGPGAEVQARTMAADRGGGRLARYLQNARRGKQREAKQTKEALQQIQKKNEEKRPGLYQTTNFGKPPEEDN